MATRVLWSINNLEVQGSQLRTKRNLLEFIIEMKSEALLLGLAKCTVYMLSSLDRREQLFSFA